VHFLFSSERNIFGFLDRGGVIMNCVRHRVVVRTLCFTANIFTFQLTTYYYLKEDYYV
jgi:hypothetical protein